MSVGEEMVVRKFFSTASTATSPLRVQMQVLLDHKFQRRPIL